MYNSDMQKYVRILQTRQSPIPVDCVPGQGYAVLIETETHVRVFGIEEYIRKDCVEFVDSIDDCVTIVETTGTVKLYTLCRVKDGVINQSDVKPSYMKVVDQSNLVSFKNSSIPEIFRDSKIRVIT